MPTRWIDSAPKLLTVAEMYQADAAAIVSGVSGLELMEVAGVVIADAVQERCPAGNVQVLCRFGNNGGVGFVAAKLLAEL